MESITAVKVSQAVPTAVIRGSAGGLSLRRMPGVVPGGGRM
jgi:hypothetical protein